ncbi:MAG TPA: hypothetical protein VLL08_02005 [Kineosporiaceae bacterium]|nr:hypothetical protein [Kineosporiaceae bacterium]
MALSGIIAPRLAPHRAYDRSSWVRLALFAGWLLVTLMTAGIGERATDFDHLTSALADGRVVRISISGEGLGPTASGQVTQDVHWRDGLLRRVSTVSVRSSGEEDDSTADGEERVTITANDVGTYLTQRNPQLTVTRSGYMESNSSRLGWRVPQWLAMLGFGISLATLLLLIGGPQPWRATRWAWFWIWGIPLGTPIYLLLSGPTPLLPAPRNPSRPLTGGWAFLLACVLSSLVTSVFAGAPQG